jgi:P pilus assembly chaperone PapD
MGKSVLLQRVSASKLYVPVKLLVPGILLIFSCIQTMAQGDLLISPLRIVFEGPKKSQEISLANVGKDTAIYAISVKDYRMKEDGGFEEIDTPDAGQNFAGSFIRIFPRKVVLGPNESQVVKVQLIKTSQMKDGEYRSHLYFRAVPDEKPLGEPAQKKDTTSISIQLKPVFGITIPVIIRVGENTTTVTLSELSLEMADNKPMLSMTFNRNGSMSVYGDVKVEYVSPGGNATEVKIVRGVGVYTPNSKRRLKVELDDNKNFDAHKGKLHIAYKLQTNDKTEKVVEADLELK